MEQCRSWSAIAEWSVGAGDFRDAIKSAAGSARRSTSPTASPGSRFPRSSEAEEHHRHRLWCGISRTGAGGDAPGHADHACRQRPQEDGGGGAGSPANSSLRTWSASGAERKRSPPSGRPHREAYDVVTARALAPLGVLLEYAAPLLRESGHLVAWKGSPEPAELAAADASAEILGFATGRTDRDAAVQGLPRASFLRRAENSARRTERFPRRAGVALKRPLA